ncbi:MAG TPA: hypothetical protein VD761_05710 [Solirubrobacterales bacterium]|nr:hypothetical protein [Solirubrobacterales bacterium]
MVRVNAIGARRPDLQFDEARRIFVTSCAEGVALNKQGRSYKPKAILNLDSSLRRLPAALVRLPAPDSVERDRIATPGEFARLPRCLESAEALPFALAAYGTARAQEIRILGWPQVDLEHRQMVLADEEGARKSRAAHRVVPLVRPLLDRLRFAWSSRPPP